VCEKKKLKLLNPVFAQKWAPYRNEWEKLQFRALFLFFCKNKLLDPIQCICNIHTNEGLILYNILIMANTHTHTHTLTHTHTNNALTHTHNAFSEHMTELG